MGISDYNPLNYNARKRLAFIVKDLLGRAVARPEQKPTGAQQLGRMVGFAQHVMKLGAAHHAASRSAPMPPPTIPGIGVYGHTYSPRDMIDRDQDRRLRGPDVWYGRVGAGLGPSPAAWAPEPEITLRYIASVQSKATRSGWCNDKADLDGRVLQYDPHFISLDRIRRSTVFKYAFLVEANNPGIVAQLNANFVRAAVENIDGFTASAGEAGKANGSGFAMQELVWKRRKLRIVVGPKQTVSVNCETVSSLEEVHNRHIVFDIISDRPYLNATGGSFVDPFKDEDGEPRRKFLFHKGYGDGAARSRGYHYAGEYLYYLTGLSVERWGIVLETYGMSTPYAEYQMDMHTTAAAQADIDAALARLGKGQPAKIPQGWKIGNTETPSGLVPLHQAILGYLDAQKSKLVVSNTLMQEMGGVGSYNAISGHADQQEATQIIDASLLADSYRTQLFRDLLEVNADVLARAYSPYVPGGCTPEDIIADVPLCRWDIRRDVSPPERLQMFIDASDKGHEVDADQVNRECGFRPALTPESAFGAARAKTTSTPSPAANTQPATDEKKPSGEGGGSNSPPPISEPSSP